MEEIKDRIYKTLLIREATNKYIGFNPSHNPDPNEPDIGAGMYEVEWNKPLPADIDTVQYKYENGELKAV